MVSVKPAQFELKVLASRSRTARTLVIRQVQQRRGYDLCSLVVVAMFVGALTLGMMPAVQAQQSLNTIPDLTPPEQSTANAIVTLCPPLAQAQDRGELAGAEDDLTTRCRNLVNSGPNQANLDSTRGALSDISSDKIPTQGTSQVEATRVQLGNIAARLAALRAGATGLSFQGLAFNIDGKLLSNTMLASLLPGGERRNVGVADEPLMFSKFGLSRQAKTPQSAFDRLVAQQQNGGTSATAGASAFGRLGIFVNGTLTLGDKDATSREAGFDYTTPGVTAGVDYRFSDHFVLGGAFGFAATDADIDSDGGSMDANQYSGAIFATYYFERFYIDGIASFGWTSFDSTRNINYSFPCVNAQGQPVPCIGGGTVETISQSAKGDTDGTHFALGTSAGYDFHRGGFTFGPFGRINYFKQYIDGYSESVNNTTPGFGLPLKFDDQDIDSFQMALGGHGSYAISTQVGVFVPQILFEWVHEFMDNRRTIAAQYVFDPGNVPLDIATDNPDRDFFNLGIGLAAILRRGTSAFLYYQTTLGLEDITNHDIVLGVRLAF